MFLESPPTHQVISELKPARTRHREQLTLAVQFNKSFLVLGQLGPARHLVDLSLQDGDLTVPPSLKRNILSVCCSQGSFDL